MMVICDVKLDTKYDKILQSSSQEPLTSPKYDYIDDILLITPRELKIGI